MGLYTQKANSKIAQTVTIDSCVKDDCPDDFKEISEKLIVAAGNVLQKHI